MKRKPNLTEAATIKARTRRMVRDMEELLKDKALPEALRRQVEGLRDSFRKTWDQLEKEAGQERGRKGVASKEADVADKVKPAGGKKPAAISPAIQPTESQAQSAEPVQAGEASQPAGEGEPLKEGGYYGGYTYVPYSITSFAQLDAANEAEEMAEDLRARVSQFQQMMNNIFWQSAEAVPDKLGAVQALFDEFIVVVSDILGGSGEGDAGSNAIAGSDAAGSEPAGDPTTSAEQFAESYVPTVSLVETEGDGNPRGPLEMDVQLIQPGWGNTRDNHYYPAEMLRRCAEVFVGAKMYTTDHRADEKSERTEVSQIKRINGFTEAGAPVARVVVFDPDFAEKCRNRQKAGLLESLECSILADGKARPGYEQGGRKGKVVEDITGVASVDWVTRAGAGGKAISLAESADGAADPAVSIETAPDAPAAEALPAAEDTPAAESAAAQPVTIREQEAEPEPAAEAEPPAPANLGEAEVRAALAVTRLPAESVLKLAFAQYATAEALQAAIAAEVQRIKEVSGAGQPFGLGESAASQTKFVRASEVDATIHNINSKFFGR